MIMSNHESLFDQKKETILDVFTERFWCHLDRDALLSFDRDTRDIFSWIDVFYLADRDTLFTIFRVLYTQFEIIMKTFLSIPISSRRSTILTYKERGDISPNRYTDRENEKYF